MQSGRSISHDQFIAALKYYDMYQEDSLYKVVCPFHGDKNPSLQINKDNDYFYCYGCGASGGAFELVKNHEPKLTALQIYAKLNKLSKTSRTHDVLNANNTSIYNNSSVGTKESYKEGIKLAKDFYYNLPDTNWYKVPEEVIPILRYMKQRGFSVKTLRKFEAKATYNKNYPIVFPMFDNGIFRGYVILLLKIKENICTTEDSNVGSHFLGITNSTQLFLLKVFSICLKLSNTESNM